MEQSKRQLKWWRLPSLSFFFIGYFSLQANSQQPTTQPVVESDTICISISEVYTWRNTQKKVDFLNNELKEVNKLNSEFRVDINTCRNEVSDKREELARSTGQVDLLQTDNKKLRRRITLGAIGATLIIIAETYLLLK